MKKTFTFWKSLFLLCALIVGSSSAWATQVTYKLTITNSDFNTTSYSANNNEKTSQAVCTTDNTKKYEVKWTSYQVMKNSSDSKIQFQKNAGYIYNSTDLGTITDITITSTAGGYTKYYGTTSHPTSGTTIGNGFFTIKENNTATGKVSKIEITFIINEASEYTLDNITLSGTYPTTFTEKDEFSHEGMTVTAHYDGTDDTEDVTNYATFSGYDMNTTGNQTVTVSYTENEVEKTTTYNITVNAGTKYTVTYNAGAGTCGTASATETAYQGGVVLPTATCTYSGWNFAGWAEASTASTSTRPTLYAAGETFYPTANTNLYAVYSVEGVGSSQYKRAASVDEVTSASSVAIVTNKDSYILNHELTNAVSAPAESEGKITVSDNYVFSLSGNNTDGFTISSTGGKKVGPDGTPTSSSKTKVLYITTDITTKWIVEKYNNNENIFVLRIAESDHAVMQYFSEDWKSYYATNYSTDEDGAMKIYVPEICYNSNPTSDIIEPSVAFEKGNTTLYLDGTTTYTNAASVTGVAKSVTGYKSSDESVATVDASGVVTAVGIGTATITAYLDIELGVHKAAQATYEVTVKNTTTIAGLKALYNAAQSPAKAFAADLTDAVVTYVSGNHAYIQDASGAIYASCGSSLTAGKKINGAVSGTITAPNTIDEIKTIDLSAATVTEDGVIPAAAVKTLAEIKAGDYDGKLVTVNGATVKTGMNDATSGGVITDDDNVTTFNIIAPNKLTLNATEEGNFTAFVSIYGGSTYRLNIYEASQFVKTRNVATAQPLAYVNNEVTLSKYTGFSGETTSQELTGAKGTVTYTMAKKTEDDAVIGTINETTGVITLNGNYGTAVITATAAATEETVGGVIQPYNETTTSYELTVSQIFEVTFSINGEVKKVRQEEAGASVTVPTVEFLGNKVFVGWGEVSDATATVEMGATYTPTADKTFFALFATATTDVSNVNKSIEPNDNGVPSSYQSGADCTINGITYNSTDFSDNNNSGVLQFKKNSGKIYNKTEMPKIQSIVLTYNNSDPNKNFTVNVGSSQNPASGDEIEPSISGSVYTFDCSDKNAGFFVLQNGAGAGYLDKITITYKDEVTTYSDYTSNVGTTNVIIDGNAESINLATVTDVNALAGVHADEITYTRTMGKLSTLYLPYASTVPSGMKAYKFKNAAGSVLKFEEVDAIEANKPYVLEQDASASKEFSATDVTIDIDNTGKFDDTNWELRGTLEQISNEALLAEAGSGKAYIAQSDGKWHVVTNNGVKVPAFRAYFITSESTEAKIMEMNLGGTTTSISALDNLTDSQLDDDAPIYNLAGQKVTKAYKGVVIQNGKKMLNK